MSERPSKIGPLLIGDKPLPHSLEAERAVLSCLLQDPSGTMDLVLGKLSTNECMYSPVHRRLYECIRDMRSESKQPSQIDIIAITERLERKGILDERSIR